jgi:hypothetical protein
MAEVIPAHPRKPCKDCPYRLDAPLGKWHADEFHNVLAAERDVIGKVFACHKHLALPVEHRGMCAGWLLDQKNRRVPSIALRMQLARQPVAAQALDQVHSTVPMFETSEQMCAANLRAIEYMETRRR